MVNTLKLFRNRDVGFIDWLDLVWGLFSNVHSGIKN